MVDLLLYSKTLKRWWWLILLTAMIAGVVSYRVARSTPNFYAASATIMIGQVTEQKNPDMGSMAVIERLAQSYVVLVRRMPILQAAADELNLGVSAGTLASQIGARQIPGTQLMEIRVTDTDPRRAALIANEVARQLIFQSPTAKEKQNADQRGFAEKQLRDLRAKIEAGQQSLAESDDALARSNSAAEIADIKGRMTALQLQIDAWQSAYVGLLKTLEPSATNSLTIIEPAFVPAFPIGTSPFSNVALASVMGALLAFATAILLDWLDDRVRVPSDIAKTQGISSVTTISPARRGRRGGIASILDHDPGSNLAEDYRRLRARLQFSGLPNPGLSVLVMSGNPREGRSSVASNMAVTFAKAGKRVVLVDADTRSPVLGKTFGVESPRSLNDLLTHDVELVRESLVPVRVPNLSLLTSTACNEEMMDLFSTQAAARLISTLEAMADIVIIDSAPLFKYIDAIALAPRVRVVVWVAEAGYTKAKDIDKATRELKRVGADISWIVLNNAHTEGIMSRLWGSIRFRSRARS